MENVILVQCYAIYVQQLLRKWEKLFIDNNGILCRRRKEYNKIVLRSALKDFAVRDFLYLDTPKIYTS